MFFSGVLEAESDRFLWDP